MAKSSNAAEPLSSICLSLLWLSTMNRRTRFGRGKGENDGSDPPQNRGVMRPKVDARCDMPLLSAPWGRSRPHLSLREGSETAPFPLALYCVGSVLAVKGSLRRFAPWTAAGRSERRAVYEGKGGGSGRGARRGESRMIKDIIIHVWDEAERNLSAIPDALSRSRGALSPAGP